MNFKGLRTVGLAMLICMVASPVWGGGLILYEINSPSTGTASAGWAALAKDAATAFQNPAGMTRLDRSQVLVGAQPEIITSKFNSSPGTTGFGERAVNGGGVLPSLAGYYVYSASDRLKLGLSALSYFGLGLDYGDTWVGRYRVEKATFLTATVAPSLAYRINNWLSIGAMLNITSAYLKTETGVNNVRPDLPDGQVTYKDSTPGVGGGFGVLIEPSESTRFGLTYYSPVSLNFNDTPSFTGLGPVLSVLLPGRPLNLKFTIPQWLMVSGYHQITDDLAVMANFGWQNWSQFGSVDVTLQVPDPLNGNLTANLNMKNTWHGALGIQYRIAKPWLLSLGFAYDSSAVDTANRSPSLPIDQNWRGATGIQYDWSKNLTLGFAYEYINLGSANINKSGGPVIGSLVGDYNPNMINVVNLNVIYKF